MATDVIEITTPDDDPELLKIPAVARLLASSRPLVYRLIRDGDIAAVRVGKRGFRVKRSEVLDYIDRNATG